MLKFISIILFSTLFIFKANSEIIKNIEVKNNNRVSKDTILIFSKIEIGKDYTQNDLNSIIQDLYETDFFSNITLEIKDGTLIIDIEENKIIQQVDIKGIKKKEGPPKDRQRWKNSRDCDNANCLVFWPIILRNGVVLALSIGSTTEKLRRVSQLYVRLYL